MYSAVSRGQLQLFTPKPNLPVATAMLDVDVTRVQFDDDAHTATAAQCSST